MNSSINALVSNLLHINNIIKRYSIQQVKTFDLLSLFHSVPPPIGEENQQDTSDGGGEVGAEQTETIPVPAAPPEEETEQIVEELNEFEENIRNNILEDEPLMFETLDEIIPGWWKEEPFK